MDIEQAKKIIQDAINGNPNSCMSSHHRVLQEVYDWLSEAPASAVVADAPRPPPTPLLKPYLISVTLQDTFMAADADEAWDTAMDRIAGRTGTDLVDHKIEELGDDGV